MQLRALASYPRALWLLAVLQLALLAAACAGGDEGAGPGARHGRGLYVRASWQQARGIVGHRVHVVKEKVACAECHDMSGLEVDLPKPGVCVKCHEKEGAIEHALLPARQAHGPDTPADCMSCHAFVPVADRPPPDAWACMRCHDSAQGPVPAVRVHRQSTCDTCHRPHDQPQVLPSACTSCHQSIHTTHASAGKEPAEVCTTCHQRQHALAREARERCAGCHAKQEPAIGPRALFPGHTECTGCHRPHDYEKSQAVDCRDCHRDMPVLGGGRIAAHAACQSCHDPHDVRAGIATACVRCHQDNSTDHPQVGTTSVCASCHDAHPPMKRTTPARACSNCHHGAADDRDFHGKTACNACHVPHRFKLSPTDRQLCRRCHGEQVSAAMVVKQSGHASCSACHGGLPHRPRTTGSACAGCHAPVAGRALAGHQSCGSCHEPHGGRVVAGCGSCHGAVERRAPAGHRACASCHEPHSGSRGGKTCTSCHASQATGSHAGVKGGCASCHSAHGPAGATHAPACASCHPIAQLPALHQEPKHQACGTCHRGVHRATLASERPVCLSCHADMKDHHPTAPRCSSCHLFK